MAPIEGISELRRLPRLGKIRLGIKKEGQRGLYPAATDYFVCPPEVIAIYGENPKELKIMFPANDIALCAPQWYKCYSFSHGLICRGDGKTCRRKVEIDTVTGEILSDFVTKDTKRWEFDDTECEGPKCQRYAAKQCRRVMSLLFMLPDVPGLGVYQLDTSSFYSIVNINSQIGADPPGMLRQFTGGKIAFIPLILSVEPKEVDPIEGEGKKTVHVLNVRSEVKVADLIEASQKAPRQVLLQTIFEDEAPDDQYSTEVLEAAESAPSSSNQPEPALTGSKQTKIETPAADISLDKTPAASTPAHATENATSTATGEDPDWKKMVKGAERGSPSPAPVPAALVKPTGPSPAAASRDSWYAITPKDVPDYLELEKVFCRLSRKSTRDMYKELGIPSRNYATIGPWDAWLTLRDRFAPEQ